MPFQKLPGRGSGALSVTTLWEGADHLLLVNAWPVGESYRRFFYADIQAVIVRRTNRRMVVNIVFGVLLLLTAGGFIAFALNNDEPGPALIAAAVISAVWLLVIAINSLRGPTCETSIQTSVQSETISSLARERTALKVLARIQPRIAAVQPAPAVAT